MYPKVECSLTVGVVEQVPECGAGLVVIGLHQWNALLCRIPGLRVQDFGRQATDAARDCERCLTDLKHGEPQWIRGPQKDL